MLLTELPILIIMTAPIPYANGSHGGTPNTKGFPYVHIPVETSTRSYIGPRKNPVKYKIISFLFDIFSKIKIDTIINAAVKIILFFQYRYNKKISSNKIKNHVI